MTSHGTWKLAVPLVVKNQNGVRSSSLSFFTPRSLSLFPLLVLKILVS